MINGYCIKVKKIIYLLEFLVKLLRILNYTIKIFNWYKKINFINGCCNKKIISQFKSYFPNLNKFFCKINLIPMYFCYCIVVKFIPFFYLLKKFFCSPEEKKIFAEDSILFLKFHFFVLQILSKQCKFNLN